MVSAARPTVVYGFKAHRSSTQTTVMQLMLLGEDEYDLDTAVSDADIDRHRDVGTSSETAVRCAPISDISGRALWICHRSCPSP